ncbi:MAG: hypothetical protein FWF73_00725 [Spirochaetes bacterium]|nr:hypothetical protein [Spirochaetota bacterium]
MARQTDRQILCIILAMVLGFTIFGCSKSGSDSGTTASAQSDPADNSAGQGIKITLVTTNKDYEKVNLSFTDVDGNNHGEGFGSFKNGNADVYLEYYQDGVPYKPLTNPGVYNLHQFFIDGSFYELKDSSLYNLKATGNIIDVDKQLKPGQMGPSSDWKGDAQ